MTNRTQEVAWILLVFGIASLLGCSTRAEPRYAFERVWTKPHADWSKYTEITVRPVNTEGLLHDADRQRIDAAEGASQAYAQALGTYMEQALKEALQRYPRPRLKLVDTAGLKTVILNTALVDLVPIHDGEAGSRAPEGLIDGIGMETELHDGSSGEVIATIGDRETARRAPLASAEPIVNEWALQVAGLVNYRETQHSPFRTVYHPWPAIMSWGH